MQHSILQGSSGKRSAPSDAAGYVLRPTNASKHDREQPPRIISGDGSLFIQTAELIAKPPKYFSTALSDLSPPETPRVRYVCDMIMAHYLAGIPRHSVAAFIVLHGKKESWDAHLLLALAINGSPKKLRPHRCTADFLRFARLVCLINRMNGWEDPLDPKNFRPAHFGEWWRPKPDPIKDLDKAIGAAFQAQTIETRHDLLSLVRSKGFSPTVTNRGISVTFAGNTWNLKGYAATGYADSAEKLAAYRARVIRPYLETKNDPNRVAADVRAAYLKVLAENGIYYGIKTEGAAQGLIAPDPDFYEANYEEHQHPETVGGPDTEKLAGAEHSGRAGADETLRVRVPESPESVVRIQPRDPVQQTRDKGALGTVSVLGIQPPEHGEAPLHVRGQVQRIDDDLAETRRRLAEIRRRFEGWIRLIRLLLGLPRWFRRHRSKQIRLARESCRKSPRLRLEPDRAYLTRLLRQPLPEESSVASPELTTPKPLYDNHKIQ